jgi:hypothetical protein
MRNALLLLLLSACGAPLSDAEDAPPASTPTSALAALREAPEQDQGSPAGPGNPVGGEAADTRHIVRTGTMYVSVKDYAAFSHELDARLADAQGFVADAQVDRAQAQVGHARLTVRVPAAGFDPLVTWMEETVDVRQLQVHGQDVTEEWVDVDARIANGKRTEARLVGLLAEHTGGLEDVLAVERELARVRGEIESAEGRMRVLDNQVSLATLTLDVNVASVYEPPVAPTFTDRVASTFKGSLTTMRTAGEGLVLAGVAVGPWVVVLASVVAVAVRLLTRLVRPRPA